MQKNTFKTHFSRFLLIIVIIFITLHHTWITETTENFIRKMQQWGDSWSGASSHGLSYTITEIEDIWPLFFWDGNICLTTEPLSSKSSFVGIELFKEKFWLTWESNWSVLIPTGEKKTIRWSEENLWEWKYFIRFKPESNAVIWDRNATFFNC